MLTIEVNGEAYQVDVDDDTPLLWVIRERLHLAGTKFSCGVGICGSCTVHVDGKARRSCILPVKSAQGKKVVTIEGLPDDHPVKRAWIKEQVPQCGYCQSGQMMQAAALLAEDSNPSDEKIKQAMDRNLCRCGTYDYIVKGIKTAAREGGQS